ncbi:MAG: DNA topoisomerase [Tissierellia bacterium]|nr:DNA topoisomerase [Tissierellia bacterium]
MARSYTNESIQSLKGADRVRKRPAVIFGSDGIEGCKHSVFEILSNSIDEAREGYGNKIILTHHSDNSITIEDFGRGIPVGYNRKEKKHNWELLFTELYAGGKYNTNEGENYRYSLGLNGLGLTATQYSSAYMDVVIYREGKEYLLNFEKGEVVGDLKQKKSDHPSGTKIKWLPDLDVFTEIDIEPAYFQNLLKEQAVVNKGIRFIYINEALDSREEYYYEKGIEDYLEEISGGSEFVPIYKIEDHGMGKDRADHAEYHVKFELVFTFNNDVNKLSYFHNSSSLTYGGSPDSAVKTAFIYEIDKFLKATGKYKKNESMINFVDVEDSLLLICNSFSSITSYENQTKKSITNHFIRSFLTNSIREHLEIIFTENPDSMNKILDQVLINKRSREKAEVARTTIKKRLSGKHDVFNKVPKFVDCRSKDPSERELFIVEGDSALGACKMARDSNFQALIPVRGKILNTLKSDYERIFKSDIIMDLMKVIGAGIEIKSKHKVDEDSFDIQNLRYDKIIITTDADVDGFQIRTLILTVFYTLAPTLLREGKVYIVESPLYEIVSKNKSYFAYSDMEKNELVKKLDDPKAKIHRSKGLGENDPDMMWKTTMNPETRKLIQVKFDDEKEAHYTFEALLGDNLEERKFLIETKGLDYLDQLDLS